MTFDPLVAKGLPSFDLGSYEGAFPLRGLKARRPQGRRHTDAHTHTFTDINTSEISETESAKKRPGCFDSSVEFDFEGFFFFREHYYISPQSHRVCHGFIN